MRARTPSQAWALRTARGALPVIGLALSAFLAGCPSEPDVIVVDPARWEPRVEADRDELVVTETVPVTDTEQNAAIQLRDKAFKSAVLRTVHDLLRDHALYQRNQAAIERQVTGQWQKFVTQSKELERAWLKENTILGLRLRVRVARTKISKMLQEEGILRIQQMRVIVIVRKPAVGAATVSPLASGYLADLAQAIGREMGDRGLRPRLWNDVRASLAERRDDLDEKLEKFLVKFVEDSDWRRPSDERYELPMIVLRSEGRLLCGFQILELRKKELAYHCTMRVDAYDLFKGEPLDYATISGRRAIGSGTLLETRQALVNDLARKLTAKLGGTIEQLVSREQRLRRNHFKVTFEGYDEEELARIETLLAGIVAEDVDTSNDGVRLVATADVARSPIPFRDEIGRTLKRFGLQARPARRKGNQMTFVKK